MTVDDVRRVVRENWTELEEFGVASLSVFGSVARGEDGPESDVDLLVELNRRMGLFSFFRIQDRLRDLLGRQVDLVMLDGLKPRVRDRVVREAVLAS